MPVNVRAIAGKTTRFTILLAAERLPCRVGILKWIETNLL